MASSSRSWATVRARISKKQIASALKDVLAVVFPDNLEYSRAVTQQSKLVATVRYPILFSLNA